MRTLLTPVTAGFQISHAFEDARLEWRGGGLPLSDHYGDPTCALVSPEHGWCVVGGEGIVIFDFGGPFSLEDPPTLDRCVSVELWRRDNPPPDGARCWFLTDLTAIDGDRVRASVDQHGAFEVNLRSLAWRGL